MEFPASSIVNFNKSAISWAFSSDVSNKISSCTIPIICVSVPFKRFANKPNAFLAMSAAVPCTGVLQRAGNPAFGEKANLRPANVRLSVGGSFFSFPNPLFLIAHKYNRCQTTENHLFL